MVRRWCLINQLLIVTVAVVRGALATSGMFEFFHSDGDVVRTCLLSGLHEALSDA